MSDLSFAISPATKQWERLRAEIHCWRGEMIDIFARAEAGVAEALRLAQPTSPIPHLAGQKYDKLASLVGEGGQLHGVGATVRGELKAFRRFEERRAALAHAALTVALGEDDTWIAIFHMLISDKSGTREFDTVYTRHAAFELRDALQKRVNSLCGQLEALRRPKAI